MREQGVASPSVGCRVLCWWNSIKSFHAFIIRYDKLTRFRQGLQNHPSSTCSAAELYAVVQSPTWNSHEIEYDSLTGFISNLQGPHHGWHSALPTLLATRFNLEEEARERQGVVSLLALTDIAPQIINSSPFKPVRPSSIASVHPPTMPTVRSVACSSPEPQYPWKW